MTRFLFSALIGLTGSTAFATPAAPQISCAQLRNLVQSNGAVVVETRSQDLVRLVSGQFYCRHNEDVMAAFVATRDENRCYAGYVCIPGGGGFVQ